KRVDENQYQTRTSSSITSTSSPSSQQAPASGLGGIAGIMRSVDRSNQATDETLGQAFRDLDALMQSAASMVKLAESISTKLAATSSGGSAGAGGGGGAGGGDDESSEMAAFRSYLVNLGISSPVTRETAGDSYTKELARQLAEFLEQIMSRRGGGGGFEYDENDEDDEEEAGPRAESTSRGVVVAVSPSSTPYAS
ncbi:Vacuolar protein-sorting-associated protein 36, partial [Quaeritorhiza haematococci]